MKPKVGTLKTAATVLVCLILWRPITTLSPTALLAHPARYDWQRVGVAGKVKGIELRTTQGGSNYKLFKVCNKVCVNVFAWGHPMLSDGQTKSVRGMFVAVKHFGASVVHNEIEADRDSF